ncbi:MAG: macro domain-containing protein [Candidatus Thorarchaeota archaeon]|nr:macro domain-containing protein [Candidatus Thorarchaeota archaeon]
MPSKRVGIVTTHGDITDLDVDAIVNAANSDLWMGSGVAGAIKRRGGVEIENEAMAKGPIRPGEAVITGAGRLKAKYVIHCAGMAPGRPAEYKHVRDSARHALTIASGRNLRRIAFPAIGAGVGGLTPTESARAILEAVEDFEGTGGSVEQVILVGYNEELEKVLSSVVEEIRGKRK